MTTRMTAGARLGLGAKVDRAWEWLVSRWWGRLGVLGAAVAVWWV